MMEGILKLVFNYIRKRRTRSYLTVIGIFIGIAAVVTLVSLGQGLQNAVNYQFSKMGSNRITISPGGSMSAGMGPAVATTATLYEKDVDAVKRVNGVEYAIGTYSTLLPITFGKQKKYMPVYGLGTDAETTKYIESIGTYEVGEGRNPRTGEKYNAVIGKGVAEEAFEKEIHLGDFIDIGGLDFQVVGIQADVGGMQNRIIRVPKSVLREMEGKTDEVSSITAIVKNDSDTVQIAEKIKEDLRKERNKKKGEEDFSVATAQNVIQSFLVILNVVQVLLVGIAGISLLVGGVGIMNTMYTSVLERTRDIGIMKAIGARNSDIMMIFILESGILGLVGGIIGVIIGIALSNAVSFIALQALQTNILRIQIGAFLILGPTIFSFVVGVASGLLPAIQAAQMKPVESLRYE